MLAGPLLVFTLQPNNPLHRTGRLRRPSGELRRSASQFNVVGWFPILACAHPPVAAHVAFGQCVPVRRDAIRKVFAADVKIIKVATAFGFVVAKAIEAVLPQVFFYDLNYFHRCLLLKVSLPKTAVVPSNHTVHRTRASARR